MSHHILIVDDQASYLHSLQENLRLRGYAVTALSNPLKVMETLRKSVFHCLLLDIKMPGKSGLELLHEVIAEFPALPIIMVSGDSGIPEAAQAFKNGVFDFVDKGESAERLHTTIKNALRQQELLSRNESLEAALEQRYRMVGESAVLRDLQLRIRKAAPTDAKVLILGENGAGKELVAWALHQSSNRCDQPYVRVNCAAIPRELQESELFGHKKGSFTGADKDRVGKFQAAHGGTLFLDEIGDMELSLQAKLLRAIENGEVEVVGENAPRKVDVRLIAATNHDLLEMVEAGTFRRDLYHRLNVLQLSVPPLRERREDIESLAYHFLMQLCEEHGRRFDKITQQALGLLRNYHWPGNIRELRNVMEKAVIFAEGSDITHADIRDALNLKAAFQEASADPTLPQSLREAREAFERSYILEVLERCEGRIGDTADALGIDRTNLFRKMQKYGIEKNS